MGRKVWTENVQNGPVKWKLYLYVDFSVTFAQSCKTLTECVSYEV